MCRRAIVVDRWSLSQPNSPQEPTAGRVASDVLVTDAERLAAAQRLSRWPDWRLVVIAISGVLVCAGCGNRDSLATSASRPPAVTAPAATICPLNHYEPTYLPAGMAAKPATTPRIDGRQEWMKEWRDGDRTFSVTANFSGDFGDDPTLKNVRVAGHDAMMGRTGADDEVAITWDECSRPNVGVVQYALFETGLSESEFLRIAKSLKVTK